MMRMKMTETLKRRIFDIESNGLLDTVTKIHCICIKDPDTGKRRLYGPTEIDKALKVLSEADVLIGHNILAYDLPAIKKIKKGFTYRGKVFDTMIAARLIWSDIKPLDFNRKGFPKKLIGKHSLEAWGNRLGEYKGDFKGPWDIYVPDMGTYCEQDIEVTDALLKLIEKQKYSEEALQLEHDFAAIIVKQEIHGFHFNLEKAHSLYAELCGYRADLEGRLKERFGPKITKIPFTPKRADKKRGYLAGVPTVKKIVEEFNPASRTQIYERLIEQFGWKPKVFTEPTDRHPGGQPKVSEGILKKIPFYQVPQAHMLAEYLMIQKRIGQIAEGKNGWLKLERNGRIHGSVNTNGTPTGRCIHFTPNISQTTAVDKPYGYEQRGCFDASDRIEWDLLGIDLSGIELRCLAHFLYRYDKGALTKAIIDGDNKSGTDMHSKNMRAIQKYIPTATRDNAKTAIYCLIYGGGDKKLGKIFGKGKKTGALVRKALFEGMVGLEQLNEKIKGQVNRRRWKKVNGKRKKTTPYLIGLDGRRIPVRSDHSALNSLLQCAGSVIMKKTTVEFHRRLEESGYKWDGGIEDLMNPQHYAQQAHIHDEVQMKIRKHLTKMAGELFIQTTKDVGEYFKFNCPLDAEYKVGFTWADTH
jgi:DNA polymerase I